MKKLQNHIKNVINALVFVPTKQIKIQRKVKNSKRIMNTNMQSYRRKTTKKCECFTVKEKYSNLECESIRYFAFHFKLIE